MTNFADAFNRGQQAAENAARARAEIQKVFTRASEELNRVTDGKLMLAVKDLPKEVTRPVVGWLRGYDASLRAMQNLGVTSSDPTETELTVAARNPQTGKAGWIKLATWAAGPGGNYPCRLAYDKQDISCHDQESLSDAIAEMLASATVGEKLRGLIARSPKETGGDTSTDS